MKRFIIVASHSSEHYFIALRWKWNCGCECVPACCVKEVIKALRQFTACHFSFVSSICLLCSYPLHLFSHLAPGRARSYTWGYTWDIQSTGWIRYIKGVYTADHTQTSAHYLPSTLCVDVYWIQLTALLPFYSCLLTASLTDLHKWQLTTLGNLHFCYTQSPLYRHLIETL